MTIDRQQALQAIKSAYKVHPIVAILGPRQCGKTTLAKEYAKQQTIKVHHFDLENPHDLAKLEQPMLSLQELSGLIIIDEIQRQPDLFPILRVLADDQNIKRQFLILGSASRDLIQQSSETLAGRIGYLELTPFTYLETGDLNRLWLRGGFPRSYLARSNDTSLAWREAYISTFLERDIPNLGIKIPAMTLRRFWMMLSHYHGNVFNASEIGKSLGAAHTTIRNYLDILVGTFMIRQLPAWTENINKRQVKAPKIYFRDSGILHSLIGVTDRDSLLNHVKLGASWEGLALEQVIRYHSCSEGECYFWGIHGQAELDLLIIKPGMRLGFEFKYSETPKLSRSMQIAEATLGLDKLVIIHPGNSNFPLSETIRAIGLQQYLTRA